MGRQFIKPLAAASLTGMIILLLGGALVTKTDSGDGCGTSWPLCHGQLIPANITFELIVEFSHRIVTAIVTLFVLCLIILCWKHMTEIPERKALSVLAIGFLIVQSTIGALNVVFGQSDFILALHFGISLLSFSSVLLLTLLIFNVDQRFYNKNEPVDPRIIRHTTGVTIYSFGVVYTGALVRHTESGMICPAWPFCNKITYFTPSNFYEWVQMGHRYAAGILFLWIFYIMIMAVRTCKNQPVLYYGWILAFFLIFLQIVSGALTVFTELNIILALLHTLFITCLFGLLSFFVFLFFQKQHENRKCGKTRKQDMVHKLPTENIKKLS